MKRCRKVYVAMCGIVTAAVVMTACVNEECLDNANALPLAGFYSSGNNPQAISIDSISIYGLNAPGDSVLISTSGAISQAYLPFRIDEGSTTYILRYRQKRLEALDITDEISFDYEIKPFFVSSACGVSYRYEITNIEHTDWLIDSVTCPAGVIDNANIENIRIYFRTSNGENP